MYQPHLLQTPNHQYMCPSFICQVNSWKDLKQGVFALNSFLG